jgi:hypothetical protein
MHKNKTNFEIIQFCITVNLTVTSDIVSEFDGIVSNRNTFCFHFLQ